MNAGKKTKIASILMIVAAVIGIILCGSNLFSFIISKKAYIDVLLEQYKNILDEEMLGSFETLGITIEELYSLLITMSIILYTVVIVVSAALLPVGISLLKMSKKDVKEYSFKFNTLGIVFSIVFIVFDILWYLNFLVIIALVLLIMDRSTVRNEQRLIKYDEDAKVAEETENNYFKQIPDTNESSEIVNEKSTSSLSDEEVKEKIEALNETYELLAKLEKSYKSGLLSEEDYKRMKEKIMNK